ncbi:MAG TPA: YkvA family protein [Pyrinomonadaceae bacterium]|nr:YkvA family protein [Pyrinomonadaceae bacterium]
MSRLQAKRRMKNLLMFVPNMIALCGRLIVDARVPRTEKLLFAGAIVYAVMPLDFIPDMLPFVGQIDDAYLIALTLIRLINHTDALVVREHWRGGGDVVQLTEAIASVAPALLPRRVERVLSARVETVPEKGKRARGKAALVELHSTQEEEERPQRSEKPGGDL